MAQFSKDELSFVKEVPEDIECPVCLNVLTDPHQVTCCGHNFCGSCIERVKAGNGACPMCKEKKYQSFVDKKCLRIINGLQVHCSNQKEGCQWKGELKYLSTHTNRGKREGECRYEEVKCRYNCRGRKKGQRQHMNYHEMLRCSQRPFKCKHCNTEGTHYFITEEHVKNCPKVPTLCPNKCTNALMPRDSIPAHLPKCPLQPVDCVFNWAGCKERPLRKDIELHTTDTKHMMLLAVACGELKKENEALKITCDQLKEDLLMIKTDIILYPTLPIIVTREREIVHFYTEVGGLHMSATFNSKTVYLAFHEGKFDSVKFGPHSMEMQFQFEERRGWSSIRSVPKLCLRIPDDALDSLFNEKTTPPTPPIQEIISHSCHSLIPSLKIHFAKLTNTIYVRIPCSDEL